MRPVGKVMLSCVCWTVVRQAVSDCQFEYETSQLTFHACTAPSCLDIVLSEEVNHFRAIIIRLKIPNMKGYVQLSVNPSNSQSRVLGSVGDRSFNVDLLRRQNPFYSTVSMAPDIDELMPINENRIRQSEGHVNSIECIP